MKYNFLINFCCTSTFLWSSFPSAWNVRINCAFKPRVQSRPAPWKPQCCARLRVSDTLLFCSCERKSSSCICSSGGSGTVSPATSFEVPASRPWEPPVGLSVSCTGLVLWVALSAHLGVEKDQWWEGQAGLMVLDQPFWSGWLQPTFGSWSCFDWIKTWWAVSL